MLAVIPPSSLTVQGAAGAGESTTSDSISVVVPPRSHKRHRQQYESSSTNNGTSSSSTTPSRYKGVVLQQNGHWGAQIYANHQRIWLGTFKSEQAAAMAYDSAAIKLRSGDCHRNFPWTTLSEREYAFQTLYTTEDVLTMIKDGSYESKLGEYIRTQTPNQARAAATASTVPSGASPGAGGVLCQELFQKELTPSDVGKLNRLVIPKKHAVKFFPPVSETEEGEESEDIQLVFFDKYLRSWKFRYCYWKSSQSYVFTRGWNRFVRDKDLKAKDMVSFYSCEYGKGLEGVVERFWMIDIRLNNDIEAADVFNRENMAGLELALGRQHYCLSSTVSEVDDDRDSKRGGGEEDEDEPLAKKKKKCLRLFGVTIA